MWAKWVAGIGMILSGLGMLAAAVAASPMDHLRIGEGVALIVAGISLIKAISNVS